MNTDEQHKTEGMNIEEVIKYAYVEMDSIENKNKAIMSFNGTKVGKNEIMVVTKRINVAGFNKRVPKNAQNPTQSRLTEISTENNDVKESEKQIEDKDIIELEKSTKSKDIKDLEKSKENKSIKKPQSEEKTNKVDKKKKSKINIVNNQTDASEESSEVMDNLVQNIVFGLRGNQNTEKDN
ncbi:hypothetical protein EDI_145290 [Entamoeba dispar SAW760]|uniref:RRM domain-containing protein n=1 Tax=Entamoeba dispar (strain ATCC PRA-260 / SAW760) TaxID=370354 RepID=B0E5N6_ENTDS|nr:uncharacterized protein EDI_145290 [Entamoeba dispar SAW760]EDR30166.1 hypothetical protein EDI_145290 [Entamoeba dispar SAW760]|eukprot:EDR30166.1 hypothetical protein EDI_145290 [Entamoeba dispar SAW760]